MRILLTNIWLSNLAGTEVYVRDLAIALQQRGIKVAVYSPQLGAVAESIRAAGIEITDRITDLTVTPDIIHGHHSIPTLEALNHFPNIPALYFIHDRTHPVDTPPKHPNIIRYLASDYNTLERLIVDEGIPVEHTEVMLNWVDTTRFVLRESWSASPQKALVFSNYANERNYLPAIKEACGALGIHVDCVGDGSGKPLANPERLLGDYDIVFAKAKAAIEALATGAAVIPCDVRGMGSLVAADNYEHYRKFNFGMKILSGKITPAALNAEILKYNPDAAKQIAGKIREEANFHQYVNNILKQYHQIIGLFHSGFRIWTQESFTIQAFSKDGKLIVNQVSAAEKSVHDLLSARLESQFLQISHLQRQVDMLNSKESSLVRRAARWIWRKTWDKRNDH